MPLFGESEQDELQNAELYLDDPYGDQDEICTTQIPDIGVSLQESYLEATNNGPSVEDWQDVDFKDRVGVHLGEAVQTVWEQAQGEVKLMLDGFEKHLGTKKPSMKQLVDHILGEQSNIYRVFYDCLHWSYPDFAKFLKTFMIQCAYRVSAKELFQEDGLIQTDNLMPYEQYVAMWREVGVSCLPEDEKASPDAATETFWMKLETAINDMLRAFIVETMTPKEEEKRLDVLRIVFDDDKMHFDARVSNAFLRILQHVRDNRKGPVCHHAVLTATNLLAGFQFERVGDTTTDCVQRLTKRQFVAAQGGGDSKVRKLGFLEALADRGYTTKKLFIDFFVPSGAKLAGTKKRSLDNPFSYGKELKETDPRTNIPKSGAKSMWVKSVDWLNRKIYNVAYRNGNGGVTLATSTSHGLYEWDMVLNNPADRTWYLKLQNNKLSGVDVLRRCFRPLAATRQNHDISEEFAKMLDALPMTPLTMGQSSTGFEWFWFRGNSMSSRPVDAGFAIYDGTEEELKNKKSWATVKSFLSKAGSRSWVSEEVKEEADQENNNTTDDENDNHNNDNDNDYDNQDDDTPINFPRLLSDESYLEEVQAALNDDRRSAESVRPVLERLGATLSKAQNPGSAMTADEKKFNDWCDEHRHLRPHYWKTATALKHLASSLDPPCDYGDATTASAIRKSIQEHLHAYPDADLVSGGSAGSASEPQLTKKQRLLKTFVQSTYMSKLEGEAKSNTRRGLDLEKPLARQLKQDSDHGLTIFKVHEIAAAPLVNRTGIDIPSVNSSADFVLSVSPPDAPEEKEVAILEVKARVVSSTEQRANLDLGIARLRQQKGGIQDRNQKYYQVRADDDLFPYFVTERQEALQILHLVYNYNAKYVCLLIGDTYSKIIAGIWTAVDEVLKRAWGEVLKDMHDLSIGFLYRDPDDITFMFTDEEKEILEPVLAHIKFGTESLDMHSFEQAVKVWRLVRLMWPSPLPPLSRLIPLLLAYWNATKGGSDTITKLIWHAMYSPPSKLAQAHAVARMLLLVCTVLHRSHHIATAKVGLPYKSLQHFRNANNARSSFFQTLISISTCFDTPDDTESTADVVSDDSVGEDDDIEEVEFHGRDTRGSKAVKKVTFSAGPMTQATPKRKVMAAYSKLEDKGDSLKGAKKVVRERRRLCTGIPLYLAMPGTCGICKRETKWWCAGCHTHCCLLDTTADAADATELLVTIPAYSEKIAARVLEGVRNTCYLVVHQGALQECDFMKD